MNDTEVKTFEPSGLGSTIFTDRYARSEEETWEEACNRVASHIAGAEDNGKVAKYKERFANQLLNNKFCPEIGRAHV
jgi:ribonucleotide reductase alpha subunit